MKKSALIIIPTYNEKENVSVIIPKVLEQQKHLQDFYLYILIVDDNSPDGTVDEVNRLIERNKLKGKVHILEREGKQGLGSAYVAGFKWALKNKFDYIFEMDADLSHDPAHIPAFFEISQKFRFSIRKQIYPWWCCGELGET